MCSVKTRRWKNRNSSECIHEGGVTSWNVGFRNYTQDSALEGVLVSSVRVQMDLPLAETVRDRKHGATPSVDWSQQWASS